MSGCDLRWGLYEVSMDSDIQLIRSYSEDGAEEAFQQLVYRHIGLVYGVALRCLNGDCGLAEDACQIVFNSLAHKAKSLDPNTSMTGWLYRHAFYTATRMARNEKRRRLREAKVAAEQKATPSTGLRDSQNSDLPRLASELLASLREKDRAALVMRFYEERTFPEIGKVLGVSEDGAEKRVSRALEKMRRKLNISTAGGTVAVLATYLSSVSATTLPASLTSRILRQLPGRTAGFSALTGVFCSSRSAKAILAGMGLIAVGVPIIVERESEPARDDESTSNASFTSPKIQPDNTHSERRTDAKAGQKQSSETRFKVEFPSL